MIGIFDSGLGGLTVLKEVSLLLPEYEIIYLGDTAKTPYGNRSQELIYNFSRQAIEHLFKQGCELVIIACNTASAEALKKIQQEWLPKNYSDKRVLGIIRPVAEEAVKFSKNKRIGLVGTKATVLSGAFERELKAQDSEVKVFSAACPLLVPLIEEGMNKRPETAKILRNYVRPLKAQKIDTLILGCTHYPFLFKIFVSAVGKNIKVLDSGKIIAKKLQEYLNNHPEIEKKIKQGKSIRFLVTDLNENFKKQAQNFLGHEIELEKIEL